MREPIPALAAKGRGREPREVVDLGAQLPAFRPPGANRQASNRLGGPRRRHGQPRVLLTSAKSSNPRRHLPARASGQARHPPFEHHGLDEVAPAGTPLDGHPGQPWPPVRVSRRVTAHRTRSSAALGAGRQLESTTQAVGLGDEARRACLSRLGGIDHVQRSRSKRARPAGKVEQLAVLEEDQATRADGLRAQLTDRILGGHGRTGRGERPNHLQQRGTARRRRILDCARLLNRPGFRRNIRVGPRPSPGRFWTTRRRYDALSSRSSRLWPSNRRPCPDS